MYLFKKIVNLGVGKPPQPVVENGGEDDSVTNEEESSSSISQSRNEESECNNNKTENVKGKKKKRSRKKKKEEEEEESSSSVSRVEIREKFYDREETSEENSTSQDLSNLDERKTSSGEVWTDVVSETGKSKNSEKDGSEIEDIWADREPDEIPRRSISLEVKKEEEKELSPDDVWAGKNEDEPSKKIVGNGNDSPGDFWADEEDAEPIKKSPETELTVRIRKRNKEPSPNNFWGDEDKVEGDANPTKNSENKSNESENSKDNFEGVQLRKIPRESPPASFWGEGTDTESPEKSGAEENGIQTSKNSKDIQKIPRESPPTIFWEEGTDTESPEKSGVENGADENEISENSKENFEGVQLRKIPRESPPANFWGDGTDTESPEKSGTENSTEENDVQNTVEVRKIPRESPPTLFWGEGTDTESPEKSSAENGTEENEVQPPRVRKIPRESPPTVFWEEGNDAESPEKSVAENQPSKNSEEIRKIPRESPPTIFWGDETDSESPEKPPIQNSIQKIPRESPPTFWGDETDTENSVAPKNPPTENSKDDIWGDQDETPSKSPPKPKKSQSPTSDQSESINPDPTPLKTEEPVVPCRQSDEFENFSETESSSKKESTSESDKKESESKSTTSSSGSGSGSSSEDDDDKKEEKPPEPVVPAAPFVPPPPPPLPPPEDLFSERPIVRPYNDPEYKKAHRRSFINVIKDVETPRRRSVVLQDSRERTWRETKKESVSSSVDYDDDRSELDDDDFMSYLGKENDKAEARLLARRQARVEAREIRLRELERQQKEQEENADKVFDMSYSAEPVVRTSRVVPTALTPRERPINSYHSSRRSSEDSIEDGYNLRDLRHEVKEIEEKFRKAMIANAQLDNEKSALAYQVELLKDKLEDMEESHAQLSREHRDKCREHEQLKRAAVKLKEDLAFCKYQLDERDRLIAEYGLVIVGGEGEDEEGLKRTLVSVQSANLLQEAGSGSLDVRLKKFAEERNELFDEVRHLKLELEEEKSKRASDRNGHGSFSNGPLDEETNKLISDYKFKLQKAEQDVSTLQANVARLESQVIRYKSAAETSEKAEDELKIEKRKLQRENRESIARIEELETANSHLQRRMDKLKNAKSALLKEL